jgi:hypothetical protein
VIEDDVPQRRFVQFGENIAQSCIVSTTRREARTVSHTERSDYGIAVPTANLTVLVAVSVI